MPQPLPFMHLNFQIHSSNIDAFIDHWANTYAEKPDEEDAIYLQNIGQPLTSQSLRELFEWKNGRSISKRKTESIMKNYPILFGGEPQDRYLNYRLPGGAIWNIFYLHCLDHVRWPIFDQHTYRAMNYMTTKIISEIPESNRQKYSVYQNEYIPFYGSMHIIGCRNLDRALFSFGKFLKTAKRYA